MMGRKRTAMVTAFTLAAIFVAGFMFSATAEEEASLFRSDKKGVSPLLDEADAQQLETLRLLSGPQAFRAEPDSVPAQTLYVVVSPPRSYSQDEVLAITQFVAEGGQLLVADNFGQANSLTSSFGMSFERVRLVHGPGNVTWEAVLGGQDFSLQAKTPTALHLLPGTSSKVLAWSGTDSYLDRDGDGLVNAWEPTGPFPVVAEQTLGSAGGRVIAVADPSLLLADETENIQNRAFLAALLEHTLPDGGRIVIDESRLERSDPFLVGAATLVGTATETPWRFILGGLSVALFTAGVLLTIHGLWGPHRFDLHRFVRRAEIRSVDEDRGSGQAPSDGGSNPPVTWSRRGRTATFGGVLLASLGLASGNLQATYAGSFLLAASVLAMWTASPDIVGSRTTMIHRVHEDSRSFMDFTLYASRRNRRDIEIMDRLPTEFELVGGHNWFRTSLQPKRGAQPHRYEFRAALRGPYKVGPLRARTTDPFKLRSVQTDVCDPQEILVLPRNDPLSRIPFKSRIPLLTLGPHLVNRAGDGTEFHALRDYQSGDSIRIVNWKASARSKGLVVNQRVHESKATLTLFLDARAISEAGPIRENPVNEGCRAALSIITGGLQARDNVKLFVYGDDVQELCPGSTRGKAYQLSEALAGVKPAGQMSFLEAVDDTLFGLSAGSPVILISGLEGDPSIMEGLERLGQRSIPSTVIALELGMAPESEEEEPEPEADRLLKEREELIAQIRGADIPVVPVVPGVPLGTLFQVALR